MTIRELSKSIGRFTWAMTLFPLQQSFNFLTPSKATDSFNKVTEATKKELGDVLDATFKTGDKLQNELVDATFSVFSVQALNPSRWIKLTSDVLQQSAAVAQQGVKATSNVAQQTVGTVVPDTGGSNSQEPIGWGPVPSPGSGGAKCGK